jgi:hypothetical protein
MDLKTLFNTLHGKIAAEQGRKISHAEMAEKIHCSKGTYDKYLQGKMNPKAVHNIMCLLSMLEEDDLIKVVSKWKENC